ncbi:AAA family ATPase, partial [Aliarcobacter butzleri]
IEFVKPNKNQRIALWKKLLPSNLPLEKDFDIEELAKYELTGGQIELVIKNTAYKIAVNDNPIFKLEDFKEQITKEQKGQFDSETKVGFF